MGPLPESYIDGQSGHLADHDQMATKLNAIIDAAADYEALGDFDGSTGTDNTSLIQAAIDALEVRADDYLSEDVAIQRVVLPPGRYKTTAPLEITKSFTVLEGLAPGVSIENVTPGSDVIRINDGASTVLTRPQVLDISLKGTGSASRAVYANQTAHMKLRINTMGHPGPSLYQESTGVLLPGCCFGALDVLGSPSADVIAVTDDGGLQNRYLGRIREAAVAFDLINADNCVIELGYIESNNRGSLQTAIRARVTDNDGTPRLLRIVGPYFENNTAYCIDADESYFVIVEGGRASGATDEASDAYREEMRLNGGGIVRGFRGHGGTKLTSNNGKITVEGCDGVIGAVARCHFADLMPPFTMGRAVQNSATTSWFDTDPTWSPTGGLTAPALSHDTSNGFLGRGSKKAVFPTGGSGGAFSRARMDNTALALNAGDSYHTAVAYKSDVSGEAIRLRHTGAADGTILECLTGTDWQIAILTTSNVTVAGTYYVSLELGGELAAPTSIWVGAVAVSKSSNIAFINTDAPTPIDGDVPARRLVLGQIIVLQGVGSPEGAITAGVGSLFLRTNGAAGTTLYVKESGTGNTGWVAK